MERCDEDSMNGLTEMEKRFASGMFPDANASLGFDPYDPVNWPYIRESMRSLAYHEAGHFAARRFTGLDISHVLVLSIIPDEKFGGRMTYNRSFTEQSLESNIRQPARQRSYARQLLLELLAGMGAEIILEQSKDWANIWSYWEANGCTGYDDEGSDVYRASRIAEIIAKPYMPAYRILKLADKWTMEMLKIPAIWNAVETVAAKLIDQGEITDENGEISDLSYGSDFPSIYRLSKWKRRLLFKRSEWDEFIENE